MKMRFIERSEYKLQSEFNPALILQFINHTKISAGFSSHMSTCVHYVPQVECSLKEGE